MYKIFDNSKKFIKNIITKNFKKATGKNNKYIVVHYTTDLNSKSGKAMSNRDYFNTTTNKSSSHYIVDDAFVVQAVEDFDVAWHCGTSGKYKHPEARNSNSIGIEMCSSNSSGKAYKYCYATDKEWYFTPEVEKNTVELIVDLMQKYNITIDRVIRHYDVSGKICPAPYVNNDSEWMVFKTKILKEIENRKEQEEDNMKQETFNKLFEEMRKELQDNDCSNYSKEAREWAVKDGLIAGNGTEINGEPNYMWRDFMTREQAMTILHRFWKIFVDKE